MQALLHGLIGLLQQTRSQQDRRGRPVTHHILLSRRCTRQQGCRRMLNLHLLEERVAVLCQLDLLNGSSYQALERPGRAQIRLEDLRQARGCGCVDLPCCHATDAFSMRRDVCQVTGGCRHVESIGALTCYRAMTAEGNEWRKRESRRIKRCRAHRGETLKVTGKILARDDDGV
jgi:hypothetical protein